MPTVSAAHELFDAEVYLDLRQLLGAKLFVKFEGFNFAGSVKLRAASWMVAAAERDGLLRPGCTLIESSSGNLGVALAVVAAGKGLPFVCVTDSKCNTATLRLIRALGAQVVVVEGTDVSGSHLEARKAYIREKCAEDSTYVWLNQYENPANWMAHYATTAPLLAKRFPDLDVLFIATGTGGTLTGCARYFRDHQPEVRVVAVDSDGSVNLGGKAGPRHIPGIGASVPMPLIEPELVHDVVRVPEPETLRMCRRLAAQGLLLGGSSGTVISGALRWLGMHDPAQSLTAVSIAPDLGERYLDSVYDDDWVADAYGAATAEGWSLDA
jgi:cysteine synthase A